MRAVLVLREDEEHIDSDRLRDYEIRKVANSTLNPQVDEGDLALECAQCGKSVHGDGVSATVEERRYYLCCTSCESLFREEYEALRTAADRG
ncbi:TRASH domain-containing protein [Halomicrobium zhouii]|uniref:TRASH domain-containing protein n=1 Tax=Halomicrobium zhouii TaxID=767519 RepID=UPI000B7E6630|nr:TRASH domain-containing protein [Halomicrobium zhouii]